MLILNKATKRGIEKATGMSIDEIRCKSVEELDIELSSKKGVPIHSTDPIKRYPFIGGSVFIGITGPKPIRK